MVQPKTTSWNLIRSANAGDAAARGCFAERYERLVRDYLVSRWTGTSLLEHIDDAVQDVFVECFREDGALEHVESGRPGGFRTFLYGVVRNVGFRHERRRGRQRGKDTSTPLDLEEWPSAESTFSARFDREWAVSILRRAIERLSDDADLRGEDARQRVEILRLRFNEGHPIRDIVKMWNADPVIVHRQYQKARKEFRSALREVLSGDHALTDREFERELTELRNLLRRN